MRRWRRLGHRILGRSADGERRSGRGWQSDPNAYIYFVIQEHNWERTCHAIGRPEWVDDPAFSTAAARRSHMFDVFDEIEKWLADKTKYEAVDILLTFEVPCAPVLSMKELAHDPALRASGSVVEVEHQQRGTYLTVEPHQVLRFPARDHRGAARGRTH
jgi:formyl-CoA transferase